MKLITIPWHNDDSEKNLQLEVYTLLFRLYLDGRKLELPKPVVVDEINPRHVTNAASGLYNTNDGDLDFEHLLLNNNVS